MANTFTVYDFDEDDEGCIRLHVNTDIPFGEGGPKTGGVVDGLEAQMNAGEPCCPACGASASAFVGGDCSDCNPPTGGVTLRLNARETEALHRLIDTGRRADGQLVYDRLSAAITDREVVPA